MKTKPFFIWIFVLFKIISFVESTYSQQIGEKYSTVMQWNGKNGNNKIVISGNVRIQITILSISESNIRIRIQKDMTPFGQVLFFEVDSEKKGNKYIFEGKDNWGDIVFGDFEIMKTEISFLVDCKKYSQKGKDASIGRLFGDRYLLVKKEIIFE